MGGEMMKRLFTVFMMAVMLSLLFPASISEVHQGVVVEKSVSYESKVVFDPIKGMKGTQYITTVKYEVINDPVPKRFIQIEETSPVFHIAYDVTPTPVYDSVWKLRDVGSLEHRVIQYKIKKKVDLDDLSPLKVSFENKKLSVLFPDDSSNLTVGNKVIILIVDEDGDPVKGIDVDIIGPDKGYEVKTNDDGIINFIPEKDGEYEIRIGDESYGNFNVRVPSETHTKVINVSVNETTDQSPIENLFNSLGGEGLPMIIGIILFVVLIIVFIIFIIQIKDLESNNEKDKDTGEPSETETVTKDSLSHESVEHDVRYSTNPESYDSETKELEKLESPEESEVVEESEGSERKDEEVYFIPPDIDIEKPRMPDVEEIDRLIQRIKANRARLEKLTKVSESREGGEGNEDNEINLKEMESEGSKEKEEKVRSKGNKGKTKERTKVTKAKVTAKTQKKKKTKKSVKNAKSKSKSGSSKSESSKKVKAIRTARTTRTRATKPTKSKVQAQAQTRRSKTKRKKKK